MTGDSNPTGSNILDDHLSTSRLVVVGGTARDVKDIAVGVPVYVPSLGCLVWQPCAVMLHAEGNHSLRTTSVD